LVGNDEKNSRYSNSFRILSEAATSQAKATEQGDYKTANKNYNEILKAIAFLKNKSAINTLSKLLSNPSIGVRLWAARFLLQINETESIKILTEIANTESIHSLSAETTIEEWLRGTLEF
jgi:HEAT repeat protein